MNLRKALQLFIFNLLALSVPALALEGYEEFRVESPYNPRLSVQVIRYAPIPEGGASIKKTPIILPHGFSNNTRTQKHLALELRQKGYEVWMFNWRGHGVGEHQTTISDPLPGDYGFAGMVTEDLPTVVDFVHKRTGEQVVIAGFSMGGMAAEQYARGVTKMGSKGIGIDPVVRAERALKVKRLVSIGSPTHFEDAKLEIKAFSKSVWSQRQLLPEWIPLIMGGRKAPTAPDPSSLLSKASQLAWLGADALSVTVIPSGLWNTANVDAKEYKGIREKGFSDVHRDLVLDFAHWIITGRYEDAPSGFKYRNVEPLPMPHLKIAGTLDRLAPIGNVKHAFAAYPASADIRMIAVNDTGHMDLVVGKNMTRWVAPAIAAFEERPESLGPTGQIAQMPPCEYKPSLLKTVLRKFKF